MFEIIDNCYTSKSENTIKLTDINGKTYEVKDSFFNDFNTDAELENYTDIKDYNKNFENFKISIKDSEGNEIDNDEGSIIQDINDNNIIAIEAKIEATHSGENLNSAIYTSESLEKDHKSFLYPFPKPFIKNHNLDEEPIGRVIDSSFGKSEFDDNKDCIDLVFKVTDKDAMIKFADKRYNTVSIAGSPNTIQCNICGKHILKDNKINFCGHFKGNTYAGKKSLWLTTDICYKECSIVNNPADVFAQVKELKLIKKGEKKMSSCSKDSKDNKSNVIDALLDNKTNKVSDSNVSDNKDNESNTENKKVSIKDLEDKVKVLENKIKEFEILEKTLKDSITSKDNELKTINKNLIDMTLLKESNFDMAKDMAKINKELLIDKILLLNKNLKDSDVNDKTATELEDMISAEEEKLKVPITIVPKIDNPGIKNKDNHDISDSEKEKSFEKNINSNKKYFDIF